VIAGAGFMVTKPANDAPATDAVIETAPTRGLTDLKSRGPVLKDADHAGLRQLSRRKSWQDAQRSPARNKGRRTMGRNGGR
jgi:hypothetical protein